MTAHAFLIANDSFDDEQIQALRFPKNDIARLGEVLTTRSIADFKIKPVYNKRHFEVPHQIATELESVARDDTLLVYYAGHGLLGRNGNLYLAAQDTRKKHVATTAISVNGLLDLMQESNCKKRILVLDCCHSGAAGSGVELRGAVDSTLGAASKSHGTYILTASTGLQTAAEREEDGHGLFTKYLIEGLETGNAARPGSVSITADDLYNYVHARVVGSGSQEPLRWALGVGGEIVLANANAKHVEERRETARKRFEELLRDKVITPAAYGNVVNVLLSTETSERIYELRRSIFDFADRKLTFPQLDPELTGLKPALEAAGTTTSTRGEAASAVKTSLGGAPAGQSSSPQTPLRPQTSAASPSRPWGEQPAKAAEASRPSRTRTAFRWILRNFSVLVWLPASFALVIAASSLGANFTSQGGANFLFFLNVLGSAEGLFAAYRRKARFWLIIPQCAIALWISGLFFFGIVR